MSNFGVPFNVGFRPDKIANCFTEVIAGAFPPIVDDVVATILAAKKAALDLHDDYGAEHAYLVETTPTLQGVVVDEIAGHSGGYLNGMATSYDGTSSSHKIVSMVVTVENQKMSVGTWIHGPSLAGDKKFLDCYVTGSLIGYRFYMLAGSLFWRFQFYDDAGGVQTLSVNEANYPLTDGSWHRLLAVYDGADFVVYYDAIEVGRVTATLAGQTGQIAFGANRGLNTWAECEMQHTTMWQGTQLTLPEIRDDALGHVVGTPTDLWMHIGDKLWNQVTGRQHGVQTNNPTLSESKFVPRLLGDKDINEVGYGFGLEGDASNYFTTVDKLNHDGIKTVTAEIDFYVLETPSSDYLVRISGNDPWAMLLYDTTTVRIIARDGANLQLTHSITVPAYDAGEFHSWKFEIIEDVSNPLTASIVRVTDLVTGSVLGENTGLDVGISSCTSNSNDFWFPVNGVAMVTDIKLSTDGTERVAVANVGDCIANNTGNMPLEQVGTPVVVTLPKLIDGDTTVIGSTLNHVGRAKRGPAQVVNNACIALTKASQHGIAPNAAATDFSGENWVLSGYYHMIEEASGTANVFAQQDGSGTGHAWIHIDTGSSDWATFVDGTSREFTAIPNAADGNEYFLTLTKSGTSFTLKVDNLTDGTTASDTLTVTMDAATGDFIFNASKTLNTTSMSECKMDGWKIDHASGSDWPMSDNDPDRSMDTIGVRHIDWQNGPVVSKQNRHGHNAHYGYSRAVDFAAVTQGYFNAPAGTTGALDCTKSVNVQFAIEWPNGPVNSNHFFGENGSQFNALTYFTNRIRWEWGGALLDTTNDAFGKVFTGAVAGDIFEIELDYNEGTGLGKIVVNDVEMIESAMSPSGVTGDWITIGANSGSGQFKGRMHYLNVTHDDVLILNFADMEVDTVSDTVLALAGSTPELITYPTIPALIDGSADANGLAINRPAGAWLSETNVALRMLLDGNTKQYPTHLHNGYATFDALTSYWISTDTFDWNNAWSVEFDIRFPSGGVRSLWTDDGNGNYSIAATSDYFRVKINGSWFTATEDYGAADTWITCKVEYEGGIDGDITITTNGVAETFTNDAVSVLKDNEIVVGCNSGVSVFYDYDIRNVVASNNAVAWVNLPWIKDSLDRTDACNHGTPTDIVHPDLLLAPEYTGATFVGGDQTDYIDLGDDDDFSFGDGASTDLPFGIHVGIIADSFGANLGAIVSKTITTTTGNIEWEFYLDDSGYVFFRLYDDTSSHQIWTKLDAVLVTGTHYRILATYDGVSGDETGLTIHLDDGTGWTTPAQTPATAGTYVAMHATATAVEIGSMRRSHASERWFDGTIDNAFLFDSEVTPATMGAANKIALLTLLGTADDQSGNGHDGTLTGNASFTLDDAPETTYVGEVLNSPQCKTLTILGNKDSAITSFTE